MYDPSDRHVFLDALLKDGWRWSDDRRMLTHREYSKYRVWLDLDSGNLGFSERMVEMTVERMGRGRR